MIATGLIISDSSAAEGGAFNNAGAVTSVLTLFTFSGNTAKFGGGIYNTATLDLGSGTIRGNTSICCSDFSTDTGGGGIHNRGTIQMTDVAVRNNNATSPGGYGGGIFNFTTARLIRSSVTGNAATYGAGIHNGDSVSGTSAFVFLRSSTVSGNIGQNVGPIQAVGAGIYNYATAQMWNSTVAFNSAFVAGGIESDPEGEVVMYNSILSDNIGSFGNFHDCRGAISSQGFNIVENTSGCTFAATTGDQTGVDPRLMPLRGFPAYHPIRSDSPAFQTGTNVSCEATDQRGLARPQVGTCDKGAYEIGDIPVVGDWDGNGTKTAGIFRPWEGIWYLRNSNTSGVNEIPAIQFGIPGDMPVVGDWNNDGIDTIGV